ncbi:MAG: hypothetical protein Fur0018_04740 [Anaerolineales bacterium]
MAAIIGQEVPYPSWADFFWMTAYLPMYAALLLRLRTLPKASATWQRALIWAVSLLVVIGGTLFVFLPIVQSTGLSVSLENVLTILYPLLDLLLLIIILRMLFIYQEGHYGRAWFWIALGFAFISISDLIFAHASTVGVYYPDRQVNLISTLAIDVPYGLGYLLLLTGFLTLHNLRNIYRFAADILTALPLVPNAHLLVFTGADDDAVIDVSKNFAHILPIALDSVTGKTVAEILGLSPAQVADILREIKERGTLGKERLISLETRFGVQQARLSGVAFRDPQNEDSGTTLVLRFLLDDYSLDEAMTDYEKGMLCSLLARTGTQKRREDEIEALLSGYYSSHVWALYNRVYAEGGAIMGDGFLAALQRTIQNSRRKVDVEVGAPIAPETASLADMQKILAALLDTARKHVSEVLDADTVNKVVQNVEASIGAAAMRNVRYYIELLRQNGA